MNKKLLASVFILFVLPLSAQTTDPGTQIGLIATISLLLFVVATLMYILIIMGGNVDPIAELYFKIKHHIIPPPTEIADDLGHDFDGIRELDNRIPPWFNYLFVATVIFGFIYMMDYHVLNISPLADAEYIAEIQAAEIQKKIAFAADGEIDENALIVLSDDNSLKSGGDNYQKYCISCHGSQGGGLVGPNLTDQYWISGGSISKIYNTIKIGVPSKGMISWQLVFSQKQTQQIASYVLSLQGTNPPGGKSPEGELYLQPIIVSKDTAKQKTI